MAEKLLKRSMPVFASEIYKRKTAKAKKVRSNLYRSAAFHGGLGALGWLGGLPGGLLMSPFAAMAATAIPVAREQTRNIKKYQATSKLGVDDRRMARSESNALLSSKKVATGGKVTARKDEYRGLVLPGSNTSASRRVPNTPTGKAYLNAGAKTKAAKPQSRRVAPNSAGPVGKRGPSGVQSYTTADGRVVQGTAGQIAAWGKRRR